MHDYFIFAVLKHQWCLQRFLRGNFEHCGNADCRFSSKKKMKVQATDLGPHTFIWIKTFRFLGICYSSVIDFAEPTIVPADGDVRAEETSENGRSGRQFFSPALAEKLLRFKAEYRRPADPSLENEWLTNSSSSFLQTVKVNSHAGSLVSLAKKLCHY